MHGHTDVTSSIFLCLFLIQFGRVSARQNFCTRYPSSSRLQIVQTGSAKPPLPPATRSVCTGVVSRGLKQPGSFADQSPSSSSEVKNEWSYSSTPTAMLSLRGQGKLPFAGTTTSVERSTLVPHVQMTNGLGPAFNEVAGEQCCFMARCLLFCPKMLLLLLL
jgi:hypothetical protein